MEAESMWGAADAARHIALPQEGDDKYTRGVLGLITGSAQYPGAAVLGVEAAARTGVGMIRYLGSERAQDLILQRRPEAVMSDGRVQAWLIGSGMDHANREPDAERDIAAALTQNVPLVLDGGALDVVHRVVAPTRSTARRAGGVNCGKPARLGGVRRHPARLHSATQGAHELRFRRERYSRDRSGSRVARDRWRWRRARRHPWSLSSHAQSRRS